MSTATQRPPQEIAKRPIIRRKIWSRLHEKDKNWMGVICGDTGSGKSLFALRLAELIDPEFSVDQVAFTITEFMQLVNDRSQGRGSVILFDEVGVALDAATHYDHDQLRVNHILETWREQNRALIMTAPHIGLIQKKSRGLLHAQLDMMEIDYGRWLSSARYRRINQNTDTGELYKKYPRLRDPETGRKRKYKQLMLYRPTPALEEAYLERKTAFNDKLNQQVLDEVMPDVDEQEKLTPQEIVERVKSNGTIDQYVSIHGAHKTPYIDKDLLRSDFNLSHSEAGTAKKLLERDDEVSVT